MDAECDGGGNRYSTTIKLNSPEFAELQALYPNRTELVPAICSLKLSNQPSPWIICPRRLLVLGKKNTGRKRFKQHSERKLIEVLSYPTGTKLGIWSEVKLEYTDDKNEVRQSFDYTFDYILSPLADVQLPFALNILATSKKFGSQRAALKELERGYVIENNFVRDFPFGSPAVIEIMTSSTSGQNTNNRTTIGQAFEDALLERPHLAPGINYRQVWSRMVSQLFVKSEVAIGWNGRAIWIVQDVLADYISATTRLKLPNFRSSVLDDVNILSFAYDKSHLHDMSFTIVDLINSELFSGKIVPGEDTVGGFADIVRLSIQPPLETLTGTLVKKGSPYSQIIV